MIPTTLPEQAVLAARTYRIFLQVKIEDALGVFNDFSSYFSRDFQYLAEVSTDIDALIAQARIDLVRESSGNSLAPLLNSDIAVGRAVRIAAARVAAGTTPVSGDFKPLFEGAIDEWGHGETDGETDENKLSLVARDGLAVLMDRLVEADTQYGSEDGTPLEEVMQAILDDWADGAQLYVPTPTGTDAGPFTQARGGVLDALQALAGLIGWVIEYRWDSVTAAWRVTLYEPNREPTGTDWTFGPDDYFAVTQLRVAIYDIRNAITLWYPDAATGKRLPYTISDAASIAKYGRRWMELQEADDSPINSAARAAAMADPALLDLSEPSAIQEIVVPLFWPVQLGDYYEFMANGVHYDVDQQFGVTGYTHSIQNGEGETRIRTRGKPAGSVRGWIQREHRTRPADEIAAGLAIQNFREVGRTPTTVTYAWTLGADLAEAWIHNFQREQPYSDDQWPNGSRPPDSVEDDRDATYTVPVPDDGWVRYLQVEGRTADGAVGAMERATVYPANVPGDTIAFLAVKVNQATGAAEIRGWATDRARSVAYAFNVGGPNDSAPTTADAEAQGGGADGGGLLSGFTSDFLVTLPAATVGFGQTIKVTAVAYVNGNGTGADGTAQDHGAPVGAQDERIKIEDPDQIGSDTILERHFSDEAVSHRALALDAVARANIIDREINAAKIALLGLDETGIFANLVIEGRVIVDDAIIARHLLIGELSEIADNVGIVVSGELRNAAGLRYINLDATGDDPWINSEKFYITAAGNAYFAGELVAATGTFAGALSAATGSFSGAVNASSFYSTDGLEVKDEDALQASAFYRQSSITLSNLLGGTVTMQAVFAGVNGFEFRDSLYYQFDAPLVVDSGLGPKQWSEGAADSSRPGWRLLETPN